MVKSVLVDRWRSMFPHASKNPTEVTWDQDTTRMKSQSWRIDRCIFRASKAFGSFALIIKALVSSLMDLFFSLYQFGLSHRLKKSYMWYELKKSHFRNRASLDNLTRWALMFRRTQSWCFRAVVWSKKNNVRFFSLSGGFEAAARKYQRGHQRISRTDWFFGTN